MKIPKHAIITREEAEKRQREAKHHTIVREGEYAAHFVHDPATGITTLVREAKIPLSNTKISNAGTKKTDSMSTKIEDKPIAHAGADSSPRCAESPGSAFAGHTPGPWEIYTGSDAEHARKDGWVLVQTKGLAGRIVANVNAKSCPDTYSAPCFVQMPVDANALLIASAPDLLRVLTRLHAAVGARMGADEPTSEQRLELLKAWEEAGRLLSQNTGWEPHGR